MQQPQLPVPVIGGTAVTSGAMDAEHATAPVLSWGAKVPYRAVLAAAYVPYDNFALDTNLCRSSSLCLETQKKRRLRQVVAAAASAGTLPDAAQPAKPVRKSRSRQPKSSSSSRGPGDAKAGKWSAEEDALLISRVQESAVPINWVVIAQGVPGRTRQSCLHRCARLTAQYCHLT